MQRPKGQGGKRNSTQKRRDFIYLKDRLSQCRSFAKKFISYLVKQQKDQLNYICHISPTPGNAEGAQMSFTDLLKERVVMSCRHDEQR